MANNEEDSFHTDSDMDEDSILDELDNHDQEDAGLHMLLTMRKNLSMKGIPRKFS